MTSRPIDPRGATGDTGVAAALARVRGEVRELSGALLAARPRTELMDAVGEIESLKSTLDAFELAMVRELEATHAVQEVGWASTQDFVTSVVGGHKGSGPAAVRLARALEGPVLVPVGEALAQGWLSTAKAQVIERAVDALPGEPDVRRRGVEVLLREAKALDATELRKLAHHLLELIDPDGQDRRAERALDRAERAAHLERHLTISDDQCGGAWIRGRCSTEDAALLKATLIPLARPHPTEMVCDRATCQEPGCGHDGRDPRDHGARMLDALVEACRHLQTVEVLPDSHGATPRVTVTMPLSDLQRLSGFATTETGEQLSPAALRRLCCDADLIPVVLGGAGEVLDVGRQMRLASTAIWKGLVARDHHCRFPHCTRPPMMTHAHHIRHWADGGETSLANLILLCGHHHRLVHAGPWQIRRTGPAAFEFHPPPARATTDDARPPPDG